LKSSARTANKSKLSIQLSVSGASSSHWVPHPYQHDAVKFLVSRPAGGLFLDPGYGKTSITLHAFMLMRQAKKARRMLVLVKARNLDNVWQKEIEKWGLPLTWNVLHGNKKNQRLHENVDVSIMNYEGLPWFDHLPKADKERFDVLVVDESSMLKDTGTQRFKAVRANLKYFNRRYILTGTPAAESLMNLFGQCFVLDGGVALGQYITGFRNQYFTPSGYMGYEWTIKPGAEEEIFRRLGELVLRLPSGLIKMPPLRIVDRGVSLGEDAKAAYKEMEDEFIIQWGEGNVTAANAAVATGKLRQIANGRCYVHNGSLVIKVHDEKLDELESIVDELEGKSLFVLYEYQHDVEAIIKRFPGTPWIGRGVSRKLAAEYEDAFNAGKLPMLCGQTQSVAYGFNLQADAHHVAYYALPWGLEPYIQSMRRVWRQGQKNPVTVYRILARDTIDFVVAAGLEKKDQTQKSLFKALEERYGSRAGARVRKRVA
jgi:hypothetical protein